MSVRSARYNRLSLRNPKGTTAIPRERDAWAFLDAAGITSSRQQEAIITLVRDLKNARLWTKMKAIYPFVGGTATTHKWNLKDPRDADAAFRLTFSGGWTHSANGADPNGVNAYADTYFVSNGQLTLFDGHLSYYARENITVTGSTQSVIGVASNGGGWNGLEAWFLEFASTNTNYSQHSTNVSTDRAYVTPTISMQGFNLGSRTTSNPTTLKFFQNNVLKASASTSQNGQTLNVYSVYLAAFNGRTVPFPYAQNFTSNQCAFASIGNGLTDSEATLLYNCVDRYQKFLGRAV